MCTGWFCVHTEDLLNYDVIGEDARRVGWKPLLKRRPRRAARLRPLPPAAVCCCLLLFADGAPCFLPAVISIEQTNENFRLLYDVKGRFAVHRIGAEEAKYKLCRVKRQQIGPRGVPFVATHDGRTIRYPDPDVKVFDTIKVDIETGKITEYLKFELGQLVMITGGQNIGRVGILTARDKHPGDFEICHVKDAAGRSFATRNANVFVIGSGNKSLISLPGGKGIRYTILEEAAQAQKKGAK